MENITIKCYEHNGMYVFDHRVFDSVDMLRDYVNRHVVVDTRISWQDVKTFDNVLYVCKGTEYGERWTGITEQDPCYWYLRYQMIRYAIDGDCVSHGLYYKPSFTIGQAEGTLCLVESGSRVKRVVGSSEPIACFYRNVLSVSSKEKAAHISEYFLNELVHVSLDVDDGVEEDLNV